MPKQRKALRTSTSCYVRLRLEPVGALHRINDAMQLHSLVSSLLTTLKGIHDHEFVHRDIRLENVVKVSNGWLLIDWELASRANQVVWWEGKILPDLVKDKVQPYTCKTDMWQLGMLNKAAAISDLAVMSFAIQLLAGHFECAASAHASLWILGA